MPRIKIVDEAHCQQCGSTDSEDVNTGSDPDFQGYSRCCNERVIWLGCDDSCSHEG